MASHKQQKAQVALAVGRSRVEATRKASRACGIIRGENNDLWEQGLLAQGVDPKVIKAAKKYVEDQQAPLDDKIMLDYVDLVR